VLAIGGADNHLLATCKLQWADSGGKLNLAGTGAIVEMVASLKGGGEYLLLLCKRVWGCKRILIHTIAEAVTVTVSPVRVGSETRFDKIRKAIVVAVAAEGGVAHKAFLPVRGENLALFTLDFFQSESLAGEERLAPLCAIPTSDPEVSGTS
jgi:hypothetical protein